jgi:hypothetical protein
MLARVSALSALAQSPQQALKWDSEKKKAGLLSAQCRQQPPFFVAYAATHRIGAASQ